MRRPGKVVRQTTSAREEAIRDNDVPGDDARENHVRGRKNVQDPPGRLLLPSGAWQNRQLSQTYTTQVETSPIEPSSGTPWASGWPSDCPGSPSGRPRPAVGSACCRPAR
ncbi:hypothetical protein Sipo8835_40795 [Streptomyces ipomoeae]|uniref:Uncharacterized protein n=1 Tax=Streptomyces ipomoeae TaxID=103232 RepID=A0AAE8VUA4_9ACTN|nr:hypothetical protein Sipo8835_40795 [Streptomyces ipomoeae]TQE39025.1 hypothetical protein Sipo7851_04615 [Streptomyces ipomoeae]